VEWRCSPWCPSTISLSPHTGNDPRAIQLHDQLLVSLLHEHLGIRTPELPVAGPRDGDLAPYVGTYRSNQLRVDVRLVDGELEKTMTYEPFDDRQERIFTGFAGAGYPLPPRRYVPVGPDLFAPAGIPLPALSGYSRQMLVSYHDVGASGATYRCAGGRMTRRGRD
jgi:hypothetical protein